MANTEESKAGSVAKNNANGASLSEAVTTAADAVNQHVDQAVSTVHAKIDKLADAARPTAERVASNARVAVEKLSSAAALATEKLGATGEQINDLQDRMVQEARHYVRAKPIAALSIAVVAGFLLSRFLDSR